MAMRSSEQDVHCCFSSNSKNSNEGVRISKSTNSNQDTSELKISTHVGRNSYSRKILNDQVTFTMTVLFLFFAEYLLLKCPHCFQIFFTAVIPCLIIIKYLEYKPQKWHYSLFELCYFINSSTIVQTTWFKSNVIWFKMNYIMSIGPLCFSVFHWHFALYFGEFSKISSLFIHYASACLLYLYRWQIIPTDFDQSINDMSCKQTLILALVFYLTWQVLYWVLTEGAIKADPGLKTSERYWIRKARSNSKPTSIVKTIAKYFGKALGWLKLNEETHDRVLYFIVTLTYNLTSSCICWCIYSSELLTFLYLVFIFLCYAWFGGAYHVKSLALQKIS